MNRLNIRHVLIGLLAGALFGAGLAISGMTNPDKVLNFLDVAGQWDPSLALVMGGALCVAVPGFAWARRRKQDLCGVDLPANPPVQADKRLLLGSALFGIGWGIAGYCPGPALANFTQSKDALYFVAAIIVGAQLARVLQRAQ